MRQVGQIHEKLIEIPEKTSRAEIYVQNVTCTVPEKTKTGEKTLLDNIGGLIRPGRFTGIFGPSGCGKTTLLRAITGRNPGALKGSVLVNNKKIDREELKEIVGVVHQEDILLRHLTVHETLMIGTELRKNFSLEKTRKHVESVIEMLVLKESENTKVSLLSGGEKKRLSVGMELLADPPILLLDEPLSGLDSYVAHRVAKRLKTLSLAGKTVVATIHQPSSSIFHLLDDVVFIVDGKVVFWGEKNAAVTYFEKIGFVCPDYLNPAEFFFINVLHKENSDENEVPRNEIEENKKTLARTWRGFYKNNAPERTRRLGVRKSGATKCSVLKQFKILLKKDFIGLKRKKKDAAYSLFLTLCTAGSYFSTMRFIANTLAKKNMPPAILRNFRFFLSVMFIIVPVFMSEGKKACAELIEEKSLFCKEYNAGYYQVLPFVASKLVITAPLQVVSAFVFAAASQWFVVGEEQAALRFLSKTTAVFLTSMMGYVAGLVSAAPVERFFFGILIFFLMQSVFFSLSSFVWYSPFGIAFLAFTRANGHEKTSGEQFSGIIGGKAYAAVPERLYSVGVFAKYALMEAGLIAAMVAVCCCLLYFSAKRSKL